MTTYNQILNALNAGEIVHLENHSGAIYKTSCGFLGWTHYGSSANEFSLKGLKFVLKVIFKITDLRKAKIFFNDSIYL